MEFIVKNITKKEEEILNENNFDLYPDDLQSRDIVIEGDSMYLDRVLRAIGRK